MTEPEIDTQNGQNRCRVVQVNTAGEQHVDVDTDPYSLITHSSTFWRSYDRTRNC